MIFAEGRDRLSLGRSQNFHKLKMSWDDKNRLNWLKFIGKTDRLKISVQNAYLANFVCFFNFPDRNLIILYKIT